MVNSFELERSQGSLLLFAVTQRSKHQALQRCRGKWTGIRSHFHNFELIVKTLWANYTTTGPRADSGHSIVFSSLRKTFTPTLVPKQMWNEKWCWQDVRFEIFQENI